MTRGESLGGSEVCRYHQRVAFINDSAQRGVRIWTPPSVEVIAMLAQLEPPLRPVVYDTPWTVTRWANPRYL